MRSDNKIRVILVSFHLFKDDHVKINKLWSFCYPYLAYKLMSCLIETTFKESDVLFENFCSIERFWSLTFCSCYLGFGGRVWRHMQPMSTAHSLIPKTVMIQTQQASFGNKLGALWKNMKIPSAVKCCSKRDLMEPMWYRTVRNICSASVPLQPTIAHLFLWSDALFTGWRSRKPVS